MTRDAGMPSFATCASDAEEAFEFLLAYAAQGVTGTDPATDSQVRSCLAKLAATTDAAAAGMRMPPHLDPCWHRFAEVLADDAAKAAAAIHLVSAMPVIGSQLCDTLNANQHLRAFLTDLFLIDEAERSARAL
jgi:hypothetical protein